MKRNFIEIIMLGSFLIFAMACGEKKEKETVVRPVKVDTPKQVRLSVNNLVLPASINELRETKLSFRVGGPLTYLNDVVGSYVRAGEVIAKIDPRDFKIAIEATESKYKLAKAEYERYKNLAEQGSVSKSVFDQMETNYKLAKTNYESAKNAYKDTELRAPFAGHINGVFVNNYEEVQPGVPIVSLLDISRFEVNAWISVEDAGMLNKETKYTCIVKLDKKEVRIPGQLKEIGNKTSLSKQSLPITIVISAAEDVELRAGMSTYLEISNGDGPSVSSVQVPVSAIFTKDNKTNVWLFDENTNTVAATEVKTGRIMDNGDVEVVKGLTGKELIVTAGANYLFEGQKVKKMEQYSKSNIGNKL